MASSTFTKIRSISRPKIALTFKSHTSGSGSNPQEKGKKEHKCDLCKKSLSSKSHLTIHYRTHTGEKPYKCKSCSRKFSRKDALVSHKRTHTGEKPYNCEYCEKCFANLISWRRHTRIHTGEKPYECQFCDYSATQRTSVITHERIHTGEKPYKCQFCSYSATMSSNMKKHEKIHAQGCGSQSLDKIKRSSVGTHFASRTKDYKCPDCPKVYFSSSNLSRHKKTHAAENRYACRFCNYFANQKCDVAKHEQREHTKTAGSCYQSELGSALITKTLRSSVNQKQVPRGYEQVATATNQQLLHESSLCQCRVCGFTVATDADVALHMTSQHQLPVVTLRSL